MITTQQVIDQRRGAIYLSLLSVMAENGATIEEIRDLLRRMLMDER
jgi:hypothetical protein